MNLLFNIRKYNIEIFMIMAIISFVLFLIMIFIGSYIYFKYT